MELLVSLACAASVLVAAGFGGIIVYLVHERNANRYLGVRRGY